MRVGYSLSCDERIRPEAEYTVATCLSTLGFFLEDPQSVEPELLLFYGRMDGEEVEYVKKGSWVVLIEHDREMFLSMVERGALPAVDGVAVGPARIPILGPWKRRSGGTAVLEAERKDGSRFPLITEEEMGEGGLVALNFDLIAAVFFFLSRIEEAADGAADQFGRFPQDDLLCAREGFESVPVVNRYLEMLKDALFRAAERSRRSLVRKLEWPGGEDYCMSLTHDVDRLARWRGRSIVKGLATGRVVQVTRSLLNIGKDPWWNIDSIREVEGKRSVRSSFFFFAGRGGHRGGRYDPARIARTLRELSREGWEVGLHGSYESMADAGRLAEERRGLSLILGEDVGGVRQHYLRFRVPLSPGWMEDAGFTYDSSVGFSDRAGFRASMCLPYRLYDLVKRKPLNLLEVPITVMDGALPGELAERKKTISALLGAVRERRGLLSVIWHQRSFDERTFPGLSSLYDWLLSESAAHNPWFSTHGQVVNWWRKREAVEMTGVERKGNRLVASFSNPLQVARMALELQPGLRLCGGFGTTAEYSSGEAGRFCRVKLTEIEKPDFKLEFEKTDGR